MRSGALRSWGCAGLAGGIVPLVLLAFFTVCATVLCTPPLAAEQVTEAWRSPLDQFAYPQCVSVNPSDGSCWVADTQNDQVVHLSQAGVELLRAGGLSVPESVSVNPADGSCWVADTGNNRVVHLSSDGTVLQSITGFNQPASVSVNPQDGSCRVADTGNNRVVRLSSSGALVWWVGGFNQPRCVSVLSGPGGWSGWCWVADTGNGRIKVIAPTSEVTVLAYVPDPRWVAVDPVDRSCRVADTAGNTVRCLEWDGYTRWTYPCLGPRCVSVVENDSSCWVTASGIVGGKTYNSVFRLNRFGMWSASSRVGFSEPLSVSVNQVSGYFWVADSGQNEVAYLDRDGAELWRSTEGLDYPMGVAVNWWDRSCWVTDWNVSVARFAQSGMLLWRRADFDHPYGLSVRIGDGSGWIADWIYDRVVHLSADGTYLWIGSDFDGPRDVSVSPTDGSCWVADDFHDQVVHLSASGAELWRSAPGPPNSPDYSVSVDSNDGSCWAVAGGSLVHLAPDGTLLRTFTGFSFPASVSVNSGDHTCWVADTNNNRIAHLAADGTVLGAFTGFNQPRSVSVNPGDGSCWVADTYNNAVVHLAPDGAERWRSAPGAFNRPYGVSANSFDHSCWVADTGHAQLVRLVVQYLLTASADPPEGGSVPAGGSHYPSRSTLQVEAVPNAGWAFDHWSGALGGSANPALLLMEGDRTVVAHFRLLPSDAAVVSSTVPTAILRSRSQEVTVTLRNTGGGTWTQADGYALSSVNPDDNTTWGLDRVALEPTDSIAPGQEKTFTFNITAPDGHGVTACDWQMIKGSTRFGATSSSSVTVYTFADVPPTLSYWRHVEGLFASGVTAGCATDGQGNLLFCPTNTTTRKEAAVFLVRATNKTPLDNPTPTFADVASDKSYYGHVERLADPSSWYDAGNPCLAPPTAGCAPSPRRFCPDDLLTRAMVAVLLCRACGKCPVNNPTPTFADVGPSLAYFGFVERLADASSWNNDPPTAGCAGPIPRRFCPNDTATRAQMAVFLCRAFQIPY